MAPGQLKNRHAPEYWRRPITYGLMALVLVWSLAEIGFFQIRLGLVVRNLGIVAGDAFPPDLDPAVLRPLLRSLLETIHMAYVGTILGALIAIPFAVLGTRILSGPWISGVTRVVLAVARTIPSLVWAWIFLIMVGLGSLAGALAITLYTVGYLGKLYYEAFEGTDPEVLEAIRATGAGRWQIARHAVLPESGNAITSQLLFIFEYNVRASSILGFVGAGGIGFYIHQYLETFQYDRLLTVLLLVLVVVLGLDFLSRSIRKRFLQQSFAANPA